MAGCWYRIGGEWPGSNKDDSGECCWLSFPKPVSVRPHPANKNPGGIARVPSSERATGFEPVTFSLARRRSTTEPRPRTAASIKQSAEFGKSQKFNSQGWRILARSSRGRSQMDSADTCITGPRIGPTRRLFSDAFDNHCGPVSQHFIHVGTRLGCVVAHADHGVGSEFSSMFQQVIRSPLTALIGKLRVFRNLTAYKRAQTA
jgi:hypothetical protein